MKPVIVWFLITALFYGIGVLFAKSSEGLDEGPAWFCLAGIATLHFLASAIACLVAMFLLVRYGISLL